MIVVSTDFNNHSLMKKPFPLRTSFASARVFGFIILFTFLVYVVYLVLDLFGF